MLYKKVNGVGMKWRIALGVLGLVLPDAAWAQRAGENVVQAADDAFGLSVGNERLGLYSDDDVRGNSPSVAGNVRIDGLYFDRRATLSARLIRGSTVRVGLNAQGYDFPAPSGIVDYSLRVPGTTPILSAGVDIDSWGRRNLEFDGQAPLSDNLRLGFGLARARDARSYGADRDLLSGAVIGLWRPVAPVELIAFASAIRSVNEEAAPVAFTAGAFLPPTIPPRQFNGQDWADWRSSSSTAGILGRWDYSPTVVVRGGLVSSVNIQDVSYADLFLDVDRNGGAQRRIVAYPRQTYRSLSGEIRIAKSVRIGPTVSTLLGSLRGRERSGEFGGGQAVDLGPSVLGAPSALAKPAFTFSQTNVEEVRQANFAVGYQGVWPEHGELNLGLQQAGYSRTLRVAGGQDETRETTWLWNLNGAAYLSPTVTIYAGYTRGLEDSGYAPQNATNANAALPPTVSRQADFGLRWTMGSIRIVGGAFQIEKPYYGLNSGNAFVEVGQVTSRGGELSLIARPTERLKVVAGAVVSRARLATDRGPSLRPLGTTDRIARLNLDYTPSFAPALSLDLTLAHAGERVARLDNSLHIPPRTTLDIGARYRLSIAGNNATVRAIVYNLGNDSGWSVNSGGGFFPNEPRRFVLAVYADF